MSGQPAGAHSLPSPHDVQLLRFSTAGSVDDGKSTLIGRLLYESRGVYEDQLESVHKSRINRSGGALDLSLITDGLRAEREQGITIDVAYRYFSTPRRHFIIADTPGHEQYTRNMATGASTADAAVVLIDASKGLQAQSLRHTYIAGLFGIRHLIAAVNKMDLVGYEASVFRQIADAFALSASRLGIPVTRAIPVSALYGDNIVHPSGAMEWFDGPTLLDCLESIPVENRAHAGPLRLPVQYVLRPNSHFRGFAGQVVSGCLRVNDVVKAYPSGCETRVKSIVGFHGELDEVKAGESTTITLEDNIDLSRGDLLAARDRPPAVSRRFAAQLIWMHAEDLDGDQQYLLKHTTHTVRARVTHIHHRIDFNSLDRVCADTLRLNEMAAVELETMLPLYGDPYSVIRGTGSFILIDPLTNSTVAAGMLDRSLDHAASNGHTNAEISIQERQSRFGHSAACVWVEEAGFALAQQVRRYFFDRRCVVQLILASDFPQQELSVTVRALERAGLIIVVSASEQQAHLKNAIREVVGQERLFEIPPTASRQLSIICDQILAVITK